jgi:hypothetical protein
MYSKIYSLLSQFRWTKGTAKFHDLAMLGVPIEFDTPNFIRCAENQKSDACKKLVVEFIRVSLDLSDNEEAVFVLFGTDINKLMDVFDAHHLARYELFSNLDFETDWENKFPGTPLEDLKLTFNCGDNLQLMHRIIPRSKYFWGLIVHFYKRDLPILPSILTDQIKNEKELKTLLRKAHFTRSSNAHLIETAEKLRAEHHERISAHKKKPAVFV